MLLAVGVLATAQAAPEKVPAPPKTATTVTPRFEVVAETKLLMEGLMMPNYEGLEKILKDKPAEAEAWTFARGQALLIAETGNLLLLRPPRNQGRDAWMQKAMDMRLAATVMAGSAGNKDLEASRKALKELGTACNKCHQTFRVPVRVGPDAKPPAEGPKRDIE
jgi:cytochrome c556